MDHNAMDESTDLRAEVAPFIPNRNPVETNNSSYQDGIPHYLTSCYPFVQDNGFRSMQYQHNPNQWNLSGLRQWHPEINMYQNFGYQPNAISPSMLFPNQRYNNSGDIRFGRHVLDSQRSYSMYNNSNHVAMSRYHPQQHNAHQYRNQHQKRNHSKKTNRRNGGVQKEQPSPANHHAVSSQLKIDFSQQTDFPLGVAFLTCEESPSSLYDPKLVPTSRPEGHEDAESDSGYYSPKHGESLSQTNGVRSIGMQLDRSYFESSIRSSPLQQHQQPHSSDKNEKGDSKQHSTLTPTTINRPRHNDDDVTSSPSMTMTLLSPAPVTTTTHSWPGLNNDEFPDLNQLNTPAPSAASNNNHQHHQAPPVKFSYSAILSGGGKSAGGHYVSKRLHQDVTTGVRSPAASTPATHNNSTQQQVSVQHSKSKKRMKKAEKATRAANEEYAQISSEQESIKKVLKKKGNGPNGGGGSGKPSQNLLNLGDLVQRLEQQKITSGGKNAKGDGKTNSNNRAYESSQRLPMKSGKLGGGGGKNRNQHQVANALDSTAPHTKRGKERETPKSKKPSALKKVILKEREEKKEERLKRLLTDELPNTDVPPFPSAVPSHQLEEEDGVDDSRRLPTSHNDDDEDDKKDCEDDDNGDCESIITTIETTVNFTRLMEDPTTITTTTVPAALPQIHSRRYREYCCQVLEKDIDEICTEILKKLVFFQDRMYQNDPIKAKSKRRYVLGLREVAKHLKLNRLKCVIISPNLEKIQSKGGLDEAMNRILSLCEQQKVTYVFALGRKAMGCAVGKLVPVSIVGIFDHSGVDDLYRKLVQLVKEAQGKYREMISIYQHDITTKNNENKSAAGGVNPNTAGTAGGSSSSTSTRRFAHMSHSRNPSAASCLSFASYISEPISELNEASNWRILMEAISDPPPLPPPSEEHDSEDSKAVIVTKKVKEEKKGGDSQVGVNKTVTTKPVVDCKSSNGTIVESAKQDDNDVNDKNKEEDDEAEVIKNLVEQKPHDLVNSWLQSAAADFEDNGQSKVNDDDEN